MSVACTGGVAKGRTSAAARTLLASLSTATRAGMAPLACSTRPHGRHPEVGEVSMYVGAPSTRPRLSRQASPRI